MKKSIAALMAAVSMLMPLATAHAAAAIVPPQKELHRPVAHVGSWTRGHRLSASDRKRAEPLDFSRYRLKTPPHGYRWVRIGGSFLMVGITSGLILSVVAAR